ncbi:MAG: tetratricopeptide repeat protein [Bacteroidetes bacterium]|nr:tetratricopeptide repeat protein [Bacteroidota bacterium]
MSPVIASITSATGWALQDNGTWYSEPNKIPFADSRSVTSRPEGHDLLGQDNFIRLDLHKIMIDDEQYNVLVRIYNDGEYEFSYLQRNWRSYKSIDYWVFRSEKLNEMLPEPIPWNVMYLVDLRCFLTGTIKNYEKTVFLGSGLRLRNYATGVVENFQQSNTGYEAQIIKAIQDRKQGKIISDGNLILAVFPVKAGDKEAVRFKLVRTYLNDNLIRMQTSPDNWRDLFTRTFYEVDFGTYRSFVQNAKAFYIDLKAANSAYERHYNWGILRYQMGDYLGAIEAFNKALEENPSSNDFMLYAYRGNTKSKMGLHSEAIAEFDKAILLRPARIVDYPNWIRNFFNRGVAKYYLNNTEGACEDWKKAYDLGYGSANEYLSTICPRKYRLP